MAVRVADISPCHHRQQERDIVNCPRHGADHAGECEGTAARREVSGRRHAARRRLQSDDPGEVRGHADGAAAVAADAAGRQPRGNRGGFAAARTARRAREVPRTVGSAVERVVGLPRHQLLGNVGDAENDCARVTCAPHERGVLLPAHAAPERAAGFPGHPGDSNRALDAERNAVQRTQCLAVEHRRLGGARGAPCTVAIDEHERIQGRIRLGDAFQMGLDELHRREFAGCDQPGHFGRGERREGADGHRCQCLGLRPA